MSNSSLRLYVYVFTTRESRRISKIKCTIVSLGIVLFELPFFELCHAIDAAIPHFLPSFPSPVSDSAAVVDVTSVVAFFFVVDVHVPIVFLDGPPRNSRGARHRVEVGVVHPGQRRLARPHLQPGYGTVTTQSQHSHNTVTVTVTVTAQSQHSHSTVTARGLMDRHPSTPPTPPPHRLSHRSVQASSNARSAALTPPLPSGALRSGVPSSLGAAPDSRSPA